MIEYKIKFICERCGNTEEKDSNYDVLTPRLPNTWNTMHLDQTGGKIDICTDCNNSLHKWLTASGATDMDKLVYNNREVI